MPCLYKTAIILCALIIRLEADVCDQKGIKCVGWSDSQGVRSTIYVYTDVSSGIKYILLPDVWENRTNGAEIQIFQSGILSIEETGVLRVIESLTPDSVAIWAFKSSPNATDWRPLRQKDVTSQTADLLLTAQSSLRLGQIGEPGLALLRLQSVTGSQLIVLISFVMPNSLASRLKMNVNDLNIFAYHAANAQEMPFVGVDKVFRVSVPQEIVSEDAVKKANSSFAKLPAMFDLIRNKTNMFYRLVSLPTNIRPGVYLKPQSDYDAVATLEFQQSEESGNSSKILYERGEVYLRLQDRMRFAIKSPITNDDLRSEGQLNFDVRCWDGIEASEIHLGPSRILKIDLQRLIDEFRLPRLKVETPNTPIDRLPMVPYDLNDEEFQKGFSVGDLAAWLYTTGDSDDQIKLVEWQDWPIGMAVIHSASSALGSWQFYSSNSWSDFPSSLVMNTKVFLQQNSMLSEVGMTIFDLSKFVDLKSVKAFLIDPKTRMRFKPSEATTFWTLSEGFKQTNFAFLAWKPINSSAIMTETLIDIDIPSCQACIEYGVSRKGVTICAERYGCDTQLGSASVMDQCDVCGGKNECLDCRRVPHGNAVTTCGVCTDNGDNSLKDCLGVCNGTHQLLPSGDCIDPNAEPPGCDGEYQSKAVINECGFCVLGRTDKTIDYGRDQCGVCNGTNDCLGCDKNPNSGYLVDDCGVCKSPQDNSFGKGCHAAIVSILPKLISSRVKSMQVSICDLPSNINISCWLWLLTPFTNSDHPVEKEKRNLTLSITPETNQTTECAQLTMTPSSTDSMGMYRLQCKIDNRFDTEADNASLVHLIDPNWLQLVSIEPSSISSSDGAGATVIVTGRFLDFAVSEPICFGRDNKSNETFEFPAEIRSAYEASCNLSSVGADKMISLWIVPRKDLLNETLAQQTPLGVTVKAKAPRILSAKFVDSMDGLMLKFDTSIATVSNSCQAIFNDQLVSSFGSKSNCRTANDQLLIDLSPDAKITSSDTLNFNKNAIYGAASAYPDYVAYDVPVSIDRPDQLTKPTISVSGDTTVSTCANRAVIQVSKSTGGGNRPMKFVWKIANAEKNTKDGVVTVPIAESLQTLIASAVTDSVSVPVTLLHQDITYNIEVYGCNFLDECSDNNHIRLNVVDDQSERLVVTIHGIDPPIQCGVKYRIQATVEMISCERSKVVSHNLLYYWTVSVNEISVLNETEWILVLHSNQFACGDTIQLKLETVYSDEESRKNYSGYAIKNITSIPQPLRLRLGASRRTLGVDDELTLDASASSDPNSNRPSLSHSWSCERLVLDDPTITSACYVSTSDASPSSLFENQFTTNAAVVVISPGSFGPGLYNFTDTVSSDILAQQESITVQLVPGKLPVVELVPLLSQKPVVNEPITIVAKLFSNSNVTVSLTISDTAGTDASKIGFPAELHNSTVMSLPAIESGGTPYLISFTIPPPQPPLYGNWSGLAPGQQYYAVITASTVDGLIGEAFLGFRTDEPPTPGSLVISALKDSHLIYALFTPLHLRAVGFIDCATDSTLTYQFGTIVHMEDGSQKTYWSLTSGAEELVVYLASAQTIAPVCARVGYQIIVKVCDLHGACTTVISPNQPFEVQQPQNKSDVLEKFKKELEEDLAGGNNLGSFIKLQAILMEECDNRSDYMDTRSQTVVEKILQQLNSDSDAEDLLSATHLVNDLLLNSQAAVDNQTLSELKSTASKLKSALGIGQQMRKLKRKKRNAVNDAVATTSALSVDGAAELLGAYEIIVSHSEDEEAVEEYLSETQELVAELCLGSHLAMPPVSVHSKGAASPLSVIQAQSLAMISSIVGINYTLANLDINNAAQIQISSGLQQVFNIWSCNNGQTTCTVVCVSSIVYFLSTKTSDATPVGDYFFQNISEPVSDLHLVQFVDPLSKVVLPLRRQSWEHYTVLIPLVTKPATGFVMCKMYDEDEQEWSTSDCETLGRKQDKNGGVFVGCLCNVFGYLAVFDAPAPSGLTIGIHDPLNVSFTVDDSITSATDIDSVRNWVAKIVNTSVNRLIDVRLLQSPPDIFDGLSQPDERLVEFVLRPPNRFDMTESDVLLNRLIENYPIITNTLSFSVVPQNFKNDFNAREVKFKILHDYEEIVKATGDDVLASTLTKQISSVLKISDTRITSMSFSPGSIVTSFIIQGSQSEEDELSAGAAAQIFADKLYYEEVQLFDTKGHELTTEKNSTTVSEVVQKPVPDGSDSLPVIVGSVVGAVFLIVIIIVVALIVIKNRSNRDKVSPISTPNEVSPTSSQRNSAQTSVSVRRISITDDGSANLRSRNVW